MSGTSDRTSLKARIFPLGQEPEDDLSSSTTAAERLAMVWPLSEEAWTLAGFKRPTYRRHETPISIMPLETRTE
jgi:hypothetical protein